MSLAVDAGLTLAGQSTAYWQGDSSQLNEGFPLFAWALAHGPPTFAVACLLWFAGFCALIKRLPPLPAEILALSLVNGHTWGAMTWMVYAFSLNYPLCLLYFGVMAAIFSLCRRAWSRSGAATSDSQA